MFYNICHCPQSKDEQVTSSKTDVWKGKRETDKDERTEAKKKETFYERLVKYVTPEKQFLPLKLTW